MQKYRENQENKRFSKATMLFSMLILCVFIFASCSGEGGSAHYVEGSYKYSTSYDDSTNTTQVAISMAFKNDSDFTVKQTKITVKYFFEDVEIGTIQAISENGAGNASFLDEISEGEARALNFFIEVQGQVDEVKQVSATFKLDDSRAVSWTQYIGVAISSFLGFMLGIVSNIIISIINKWKKKREVIPNIKKELRLIKESLAPLVSHENTLFLETPVWKVSTSNDNIYLINSDEDFYKDTVSIYSKLSALRILEVNFLEHKDNIFQLRQAVVDEINKLLGEE